MSTKFTLTAAIFSATLAALAKGTKLADHANVVVSVGSAPDVDSFVSAFKVKREAEAESVSLSQLSLPKATTSKGIRAAAADVDKFNKAFPLAPRALAVKADGSFYLVSLPKPRKARNTSGETSSKSRISAFVACERGIKAGDKFTVSKEGDGYMLQLPCGERSVKRGKLAEVLLTYYSHNEEGAALTNTAAVLVKYGYKVKQ